eukprot:5975033-Amphidinium_carterae.1
MARRGGLKRGCSTWTTWGMPRICDAIPQNQGTASQFGMATATRNLRRRGLGKHTLIKNMMGTINVRTNARNMLVLQAFYSDKVVCVVCMIVFGLWSIGTSMQT